MKNVLVRYTNGEAKVIKCETWDQDENYYSFKLKDKSIQFPTNEVDSVEDQFVLPQGKVTPRNRR